jgi:hypothetical protein
MIIQKAAIGEKFANCDRGVELAEAYTTQANKSRAMALASRCASHHSSYKVLRERASRRMKQSTEPATPESTQPEPPHPQSPWKQPNPNPPPVNPRKIYLTTNPEPLSFPEPS